jgi:hypothetical protein
MTQQWPALVVALATLPGLEVARWLAVAAAGWGIHVWRLRRRERAMLAAVSEWQGVPPDDARVAAATDELEQEEVPYPAPLPVHDRRVLVVDDRKGQRDEVAAALDRMGFRPVFADSPWAAAVATRQAEADGQPYGLILVNSSLEGKADEAPRTAGAELPTAACV